MSALDVGLGRKYTAEDGDGLGSPNATADRLQAQSPRPKKCTAPRLSSSYSRSGCLLPGRNPQYLMSSQRSLA